MTATAPVVLVRATTRSRPRRECHAPVDVVTTSATHVPQPVQAVPVPQPVQAVRALLQVQAVPVRAHPAPVVPVVLDLLRA